MLNKIISRDYCKTQIAQADKVEGIVSKVIIEMIYVSILQDKNKECADLIKMLLEK